MKNLLIQHKQYNVEENSNEVLFFYTGYAGLL